MHGHIPKGPDQTVEHVKNDVRFRTIGLKDIVNHPIASIISMHQLINVISNRF